MNMSRNIFLAVMGCFASVFMAMPAQALFEDDTHISSDRDNISLDVNRTALNQVQSLFERGYPAHSVYLHGIGIGMSIDDLVYLAVRADPANAERLTGIALQMLPGLPNWACREGSLSAADRYAPHYTSDDLGGSVTLSEIARRFFENNQRLAPFPDWSNGYPHIELPTSELQGYVSPQHWYQVGRNDRPVEHPLMVSLYRNGQRVVVDNRLGQVERAVAAGQPTIKVVIVYNDDYQRPVSDFGDDPSMSDIVGAFFADSLRLTHVPNWKGPFGDFHEITSIDEIAEFVDIPLKEDIDEARWEKVFNELSNNGFRDKPVMVSLFENDQQLWVDQPERLTAARELGMDQVPTVYLYHSIERLPCAAVPGSDCEDRVRRAAAAAMGAQSGAGLSRAGSAASGELSVEVRVSGADHS